MVRAPKKALRLTKAIASAARLPARVTGGRGSGDAHAFSPAPGEHPVAILRVQVVGCRDLAAKDKNGQSDPFVTVTVLSTKQHTPVEKRNRNPVYSPKDATFDFPIYLSLAHKLGAIELVVWDKDMLKKDYLGEVSLTLEDWFASGNGLGFRDPENQMFSTDLSSTRTSTPVEGSIQIKLGFVDPPNTHSLMDFSEVYAELVKRSRPSLMSVPPMEGIGTIRSHQTGPAFEDDGLSSDEGDGEGEAEFCDLDLDGDSSGEEDESERTRAHAHEDGQDPSPPAPLSRLYIPPVALRHRTEPLPQSPRRQGSADVEPSPIVVPPTPSSTGTTSTKVSPATSSSEKEKVHAEKVPATSKPSTPGFIPKILRRPTFPHTASSTAHSSTSALGMSTSSSGVSTPGTQTPGATPRPARPLAIKGKSFRKKRDRAYNFSAENDIVGIVLLEIQGATDLPRLKNMTRTGWDMDPFVVISFGKKVFRTRVIRHSRNPQWDEKLLFHVRRYETKFNVQLAVLDWDKLTSNDHIGDATFNVQELCEMAPQPDPATGLFEAGEDGMGDMKEYKLPLTTTREMPWESRHSPMLTFKAKYQSYDALRQKFWRQYLKQYDSDDTGTISHLELTSMLDSLASTLSGETVNSFFTRYDKDPQRDELTVSEAVLCLETELCRPQNEKKRLDADDYRAPDASMPATPLAFLSASGPGSSGDGAGPGGLPLALDKMDFSGPPGNMPSLEAESAARDAAQFDPLLKPNIGPTYTTEPMQLTVADIMGPSNNSNNGGGSGSGSAGGGSGTPRVGSFGSAGTPRAYPGRIIPAERQASYSGSDVEGDESGGSSSSSSRDQVERVINVKTCPLCHRPRLNAKAEMDIVTHLAICASQDWERVDRIVVGNFVTSSQAQRKWIAKLIGKVSSGAYQLGANSANIIVQNRLTGQLEEEKMQVYVRLGIRLLYKGAKGRMEGARARKLLKSLSIKQGVKYDSPQSAREIMPFIQFHKLKVEEFLDPISSFKTFNQFFYRKLKPDARPVEEPDNPARLVSTADCRMMAFETVSEATKLWIKGREFTVARLLGPAYQGQADRYQGGALAIFRLAPQDYHRFHSPVDGTIGPMTYIAGEYYTVNPQAVRTGLDIYGENARKIVPIDSPTFGRVMAVCVGAMMVGSIVSTVQEGQQIKRGEEFGYFAFGGSTIVLLLEKGSLEWDEDLLINGRASLETLVRVGMGIGRSRRS